MPLSRLRSVLVDDVPDLGWDAFACGRAHVRRVHGDLLRGALHLLFKLSGARLGRVEVGDASALGLILCLLEARRDRPALHPPSLLALSLCPGWACTYAPPERCVRSSAGTGGFYTTALRTVEGGVFGRVRESRSFNSSKFLRGESSVLHRQGKAISLVPLRVAPSRPVSCSWLPAFVQLHPALRAVAGLLQNNV